MKLNQEIESKIRASATFRESALLEEIDALRAEADERNKWVRIQAKLFDGMMDRKPYEILRDEVIPRLEKERDTLKAENERLNKEYQELYGIWGLSTRLNEDCYQQGYSAGKKEKALEEVFDELEKTPPEEFKYALENQGWKAAARTIQDSISCPLDLVEHGEKLHQRIAALRHELSWYATPGIHERWRAEEALARDDKASNG